MCWACGRPAPTNELLTYGGRCEDCYAESMMDVSRTTTVNSDKGHAECCGEPGRTAVSPETYLRLAVGK